MLPALESVEIVIGVLLALAAVLYMTFSCCNKKKEQAAPYQGTSEGSDLDLVMLKPPNYRQGTVGHTSPATNAEYRPIHQLQGELEGHSGVQPSVSANFTSLAELVNFIMTLSYKYMYGSLKR